MLPNVNGSTFIIIINPQKESHFPIMKLFKGNDAFVGTFN